MASALNHPHIVTVYDAGDFEDQQYLVTEFVDGGTLRSWVKAEKRSWKQIVDLLSGVASGLAAAHAAGILHRDVKPENILVAKSGYCKLADFGLAKLASATEFDLTRTLTAHTRPGIIVGTIPYMSPEQASGNAVDARSDIFSFGVVLYEALGGKRPFRGPTDMMVLQSIIHQPPEPLREDVPLLLRIAVEKALEKDPAERYQNMSDLAVDLKRATRIRIAEPTPASAVPRNRTWVAVGVLLLLLAAGAVFWNARRPAPFENPLANAHFTRLTDFPGFEEDAAISPDGKFVVFLSDREGPYDIWLNQLATGQFFNLSKGQQSDSGVMVRKIGFSGDGSRIWIADSLNQRFCSMIPLMGGQPRPFAADMYNPAWSADASRMVYHTGGPNIDDAIYVADPTGANRRELVPAQGGLHYHYPTWSIDNQWIYFVKGNFVATAMDLWRIPSAGGDAERLTHLNTDVRYVTPLDERTMLFISPDKDGSGPWLWAFDVVSKLVHRISFGLERYTSLSASADGRRLAATVTNPTASLWSVPIMDHAAEERDAKPYPLPTVRAQAPRFARSSLFYLSSRGTGDGLWRNQNNESIEMWRGQDGTLLEPPAPSPDGRRVCVGLRRQGKLRLGILSTESAEVQTMVDSVEVQGAASWSADGKWIVTGGSDGSGPGLFKIPVDGGTPARLTKGPGTNPVWSPDGRLIIYTGNNLGILAPLLAAMPDGSPVNMPKIMVRNGGERYRFTPNGKSLIYMQGDLRSQDFWSLDLATHKTRQLTRLGNRAAMRTFDITPDGKRIVFDRLVENSDIVLIDLPGGGQKP